MKSIIVIHTFSVILMCGCIDSVHDISTSLRIGRIAFSLTCRSNEDKIKLIRSA